MRMTRPKGRLVGRIRKRDVPHSLRKYWRHGRLHRYDPLKYGITHSIRVNVQIRSASKGLSRDVKPTFEWFNIYGIKGERALLQMFYRLLEELQGFEQEVRRLNDPEGWRQIMKLSRRRWVRGLHRRERRKPK